MKKCLTCKRKFSKRNGRNGCCWPCYDKQRHSKNPIAYAFKNLKSNAKRRRIVFTLTLEQFTHFCYAYDYMTGKGRSKTSYTVDRIKENEGYTFENIQVLTNQDNNFKRHKRLEYDWETKYATVITSRKEIYTDQPF